MSTTDNTPTAGTTDTSEDLLTLDLDRLASAGKNWQHLVGLTAATADVEPHWILGFAIEDDIITWDRNRWNRPAFGAHLTDTTGHRIEFTIAYDFTDTHPITVVAVDETDYPEGIDDLTDDERNAVPSTLVPDPPTVANWLSYIVDSLNELHRGTTELVHAWPRP